MPVMVNTVPISGAIAEMKVLTFCKDLASMISLSMNVTSP